VVAAVRVQVRRRLEDVATTAFGPERRCQVAGLYLLSCFPDKLGSWREQLAKLAEDPSPHVRTMARLVLVIGGLESPTSVESLEDEALRDALVNAYSAVSARRINPDDGWGAVADATDEVACVALLAFDQGA
jgi:hypothetical protein